DLLNSFPRPSVFLDALRGQRRWTGELTNVRRDGLRIVVESRMIMERDSGQPTMVFETNSPDTERKVLDDNLRRQAAEVVTADPHKAEFRAFLARELRHPLAPLRNALQIRRQQGIAAPVLDRVREVMGRQIHVMSRMVDELLDIPRITLGRIELRKEPINLLGVVERAVEALRADLQDRDQELV